MRFPSKLTVLSVLVLFLVESSGVAAAGPFQWNVQVVDFAGYTGLYNSIAVDAQGLPHIAYREFLPLEFLRYAHWDGTAWVTSTVDEGPGAGQRASIAVDSQGRPHIAYRFLLEQRTDQVRYARWNGSAWQIFVVESFTGLSIQSTSIVMDGNDLPHIAYMHIGQVINPRDPTPLTVVKVKYARPTGLGTWGITLIESRERVSGALYPISLALDNLTRPHLAYPLYTLRFDGEVSYQIDHQYSRTESGLWKRSTIESYTWDIPSTAIAMTLDAGGTPNVAYRSGDLIRHGLLTEFQVNGTMVTSTWKTTNIDRIVAPSADVNIFVGPSGRVHVLYTDFLARSFVLRYAARLDHRWQRRIVDSIDATPNAVGILVDASLAVAPGDVPHVSYYDPVNVDLKYATPA